MRRSSLVSTTLVLVLLLEANGKRTADEIAAMLGGFFAQHGWIAPQ